MTKLLITTLLASCVMTGCMSVSKTEAPKPVDKAPVVSAPATPTDVKAKANISVTVTGFKKSGGQVMAALVNEAGYMGSAPLQGRSVDVSGDEVSFSFEGVTPGEYAIRMFHDADSDGEMGANAFGIPTEQYGFSNNAAGMMGPPKWEDAKFTVTADGASQSIKLN